MEELDDLELVARFQAMDDLDAFNCLVRRHQAKVRVLLIQMLGSSGRQDADDLAQEVFLRVHRKLHSFRRESSFSTWLYRITYRTFLNSRRKRRETPLSPEDLVKLSGSSENAPSVPLRMDLAQALKLLSERQRAAILLNYQNGFSHPDISRILRVPLGTVKTLILQARTLLQQHLTDAYHES